MKIQELFDLDAGKVSLQSKLANGWKVVFVINANQGRSTYLILEK